MCGIVDLQKVFDTVQHHILLDKLFHYSIRGKENQWFQSFLTNRKQFVSISGFTSSVILMSATLFNIYINDLKMHIMKKFVIYYFVDGTNLLFASKYLANVELVMFCGLDCVRANKLSFS